MSELNLLHTERRWQKFVLVPLNIAFIVSLVLALSKGAWLAAGAFLFLALYIGFIGAKLQIHRGKRFEELSRGISPTLPDAPHEPEQENLSDAEMRVLAETMIRTNYAIAGATVIFCLIAGIKWYWTILAGVSVWLIGQPIGSIAIALLASPKSLRRRLGGG